MLTRTPRRLRSVVIDSDSVPCQAKTRVIGFLLDELPTVQGSKDGAEIVLPAVKHVIASRLAMSGEILSRVFRELTRARLIRVDGPHIFVRNVPRLRTAY